MSYHVSNCLRVDNGGGKTETRMSICVCNQNFIIYIIVTAKLSPSIVCSKSAGDWAVLEQVAGASLCSSGSAEGSPNFTWWFQGIPNNMKFGQIIEYYRILSFRI